MNRLHKIFFTLLALASLMFCGPGNARAASDGVVDDAHIFSQDAINELLVSLGKLDPAKAQPVAVPA